MALNERLESAVLGRAVRAAVRAGIFVSLLGIATGSVLASDSFGQIQLETGSGHTVNPFLDPEKGSSSAFLYGGPAFDFVRLGVRTEMGLRLAYRRTEYADRALDYRDDTLVSAHWERLTDGGSLRLDLRGGRVWEPASEYGNHTFGQIHGTRRWSLDRIPVEVAARVTYRHTRYDTPPTGLHERADNRLAGNAHIYWHFSEHATLWMATLLDMVESEEPAASYRGGGVSGGLSWRPAPRLETGAEARCSGRWHANGADGSRVTDTLWSGSIWVRHRWRPGVELHLSADGDYGDSDALRGDYRSWSVTGGVLLTFEFATGR